MPVYDLKDWKPKLAPGAWIAPGAVVAGRVELGPDASVWFGAVIRGDMDRVSIGARSNIQDGAVCHQDTDQPLVVGERCTVGHRAVIHGCTLEDDVLVGMGAVILNGARVGRGSLVAAGALVREGMEIPPFSLVVGVPAVIKRSLPEDETLARRERHAAHYVEEAHRWRDDSRERRP